MMTSDVCEVLIKSDAWGTRGVLNVCRGLTREQFHKKFEIGLGSLHETLTHVVGTMRRWTDRLAGRTARPMLNVVPEFPHLGGEKKDRTPDELLVLLKEAEEDLLRTVASFRGDHAATLSLEWPGEAGEVKVYSFTRAAVIAHVTTHGYHHRAQCLNMLRHLSAPVPGVTAGLPEPSAVDWQAETEAPPTIKRK